ncbi:phage tail assembly chaperone [Sandarakinorhabdus sp.]|uniref:phage tail assembly chaperone n=1 Tax=Sandarakinorhabdus sp. TaxID=1916663 RepID=UPI003F70D7F3
MTFADAARRAAHVAAAVLGWRPGEFWAATPAELLTALGLDTAPAAPADAAKLAALMEAFPDG